MLLCLPLVLASLNSESSIETSSGVISWPDSILSFISCLLTPRFPEFADQEIVTVVNRNEFRVILRYNPMTDSYLLRKEETEPRCAWFKRHEFEAAKLTVGARVSLRGRGVKGTVEALGEKALVLLDNPIDLGKEGIAYRRWYVKAEDLKLLASVI